ncbi:DMT family transporter [Zoogloea oryzae]|uniref:DMT family transporter n=1 Tax=Zoogloea oryzae TaxID=310767 RepID=UPI0024E04E33|nr:DMT family transporter [Zoogloea oryzae]
MGSSHIGHILAGVALCMFASNVVVTKLATARLTLAIGFVVTVMANVLICALALYLHLTLRSEPLKWNLPGLTMFLVAGIFSTYLGRFFFFESIHRLGPTRASVFQLSSPLFAATIGWIMIGEELKSNTIVGMVVTLYGIYLVGQGKAPHMVSPTEAMKVTTPPNSSLRMRLQTLAQSGVFLGFGGSIAYAVSNVMRASAIHNWNEPILGALLGASSGLALHVVTSSEMRNLMGALKASDKRGIGLYLLSGVLTSAGQIFAISSMAFIPAAVSALITLCSPILVLPASYWFLQNKEGITIKSVLGATLSLCGAAAVIWSDI